MNTLNTLTENSDLVQQPEYLDNALTVSQVVAFIATVVGVVFLAFVCFSNMGFLMGLFVFIIGVIALSGVASVVIGFGSVILGLIAAAFMSTNKAK